MSPSPLSPAVSRFAALGLTLAVILLVGGLALEPALRRIVGLGDGIEAKREHLGRLMLLATRAPDASQSQRMAARLLADAYLEGGTEAVQFANLQAAVGRVAEAAGVRLRSTQTLPVTQRDDLAFPGLQSTVQVPIEALRRLLFGIETHRPLLLVDAVEIAPLTASAPGAADERLLQVNLRLRGVVDPGKKAVTP